MAVPGAVTDLSRIQASNVTFQSDGATIDAYLARPATGSALGGIVVIHEAFGPVEHIHDVARRLANAGFIALAPNLYARAGAPDPNNFDSVLPKMFALPDAEAVRDLEAAAAFIRAQPGSNGKAGAVGFCSGGRHTLLFACSSTKLDAAVPCWGGFITRATFDAATTSARPTPVIDLVPNIACPVFAVFGEEDDNPSVAEAQELEKRFKQHGKDGRVAIFKNAGHAFLADYRPSYQEKAAFELWPQIISFFEKHLS